MEQLIGYRTAYDYVHSSYGQSTVTTMNGQLKYVAWDGTEPFLNLLVRAEPAFAKRAKRKNQTGDSNFRFEITHRKVGGPVSFITHPVDREIVPINKNILQRIKAER